MVPFYKRVVTICLLGLACACTDTPRPEAYPDTSGAGTSHTQTVALQEKPEAVALAVGDSVVHLVEGSFLQLAEGQPRAQALFVAQPDKLPAVQVLLQRYQARLERKPLSEKQLKSGRYQSTFFSGRAPLQAQVQQSQGQLIYQRPIQVKRRNCASCDEPSLLNFMAPDLDQLRVYSTQGRPEGFEVGTVTGLWVIYFPTSGIRP
ncbi:hypothetical protein GU926_12075 [Nibribacter ruber]|uniref:Uncharacterized protein n=1 Tax=Nibribacter ruber TaxID=2698458 RepID=A0A6P1P0E8_9BACT|nr:hypothetical protein [Nibribacter ruber]QHL88129.1 hypothetical protein GU926_12075 [Nibribacter ruber]